VQPISQELMEKIEQFVAKKRGRAYTAVPHPALAHLPVVNSGDRFDIIAPHLGNPGATVLDVGTHWGYMAHRLEDAGFDVTAVERSPLNLEILEGLRDACGKSFEIHRGDFVELTGRSFDIMIAFNIFHHSLRTEARYDDLIRFLGAVEVKTIFFQSHSFDEKKMTDAFRNLDPQAFADFIMRHARLTSVERIGNDQKREIFKIS